MTSTAIPNTVTPERLDALAAHLDSLSDEARVRFVRALGAKTQARLWEAAEGRPASLNDLVPPSVGPGVEVIHRGKNSLPLLSHFEKRFCRSVERDDTLFGYNEGPTRDLVGPGYFVVHSTSGCEEIAVDYREVPAAHDALPLGWPELRENGLGLQKLLYANMVDHMRRISRHVTIGRATREGRVTNNFFLLCRVGD